MNNLHISLINLHELMLKISTLQVICIYGILHPLHMQICKGVYRGFAYCIRFTFSKLQGFFMQFYANRLHFVVNQLFNR